MPSAVTCFGYSIFGKRETTSSSPHSVIGQAVAHPGCHIGIAVLLLKKREGQEALRNSGDKALNTP